MSSKVEACPMCTQSCLMTHGNKTNSRTLVSSFFKVLIGDMFSTILYFPPKFAPTVSSLNGQETFLEDSSGQRWKVKVSVLNDCFVLQEGWSEFASDHGLELGDFIIFNYIMGSHFEVHIYDKNPQKEAGLASKESLDKGLESTREFRNDDFDTRSQLVASNDGPSLVCFSLS
ncbi:hypothetical protein OIU78_016753 [Salix suchowensis]|nr:hypothetical protein OIU78_016753 [Salix suchowensis]